MNIQAKNQNGFTLIELLIALVIFAVGILGMATMQLTSIKGNSKGRFISEASNLASDRIEMFLSTPYMPNNCANNLIDDDGDGLVDELDEQVSDGAGTNNGALGLIDMPPNTDVGPVPSADGNYQIYWNVAADYPVASTKTIRVIVDPPGNGPNVEMEIVKAKPI
jgi:type IV pilus assembly protein PilV